MHEGASTRMLIAAAKLMKSDLSFIEACLKGIVHPMTDDHVVVDFLEQSIRDLG